MTKFSDIKQDTPRIVVMFKEEDGRERFQWGMIGNMPVLTLIGYIARVQVELPLLEPGDLLYKCPEQALVIAWDADKKKFNWFVHEDAPVDSMVGMLETIKFSITSAQAAEHEASRQFILGPDGRPTRSGVRGM